MSKFLRTMIVLLAITAMAAPVIAADNFSVGGQMRVRAAYKDFGGSNTATDIDQRLRVGGKFTVSDNVSLTFRTDFSEGDWGTDGALGRFGTIKDMDRAHLDLNFDSFALRAGTQYVAFGKATVDFQDTAFKFTLKGDVPVTLFYSLYDANGSFGVSDTHLYGANVAFGPANVFVASLKAGGSAQEVYVAGASVKYKLDAVKIAGELDYFTGDASATVDAMGLQAYVDASFAAGEATTVGGALYYALGADTGEAQYSFLGNGFGGWDPLNHGPLQNGNLQAYTRPYDAFGDAGVIALQVYADFAASDALGITSSIVYAEPEEDANTAADSAMFLNVGLAYKVMENTKLLGQVQYVDYDATGVDAMFTVGSALVVNF